MLYHVSSNGIVLPLLAARRVEVDSSSVLHGLHPLWHSPTTTDTFDRYDVPIECITLRANDGRS
jgi:hypothetical protein